MGKNLAIGRNTEMLIKLEQLQPGMFVRLDAGWFGHPFLFNRFKIKNPAQIDSLKKSGITEVYYIPEKSDCLPLPFEEPKVKPKTPAAPPQEDPVIQLLWRIKKERIEILKEKRENLRKC